MEGMTPKEMERFINWQIEEEGKTELEALMNLMKVLGVEIPQNPQAEKEED